MKTFYKEDKDDKIWWVDDVGTRGTMEFSFDKKKIYEFYRDYPFNLTPEEREIFDKENPYLAKRFGNRKGPL